MHSSTVSTASLIPTTTTSTTTTSNHEQYHCPSISLLRRAIRPSNIDLPVLDNNHHSQTTDPGIYSAPIYYLKPGNHPPAYITQSSYPANFQHLPLSAHSPQHHNVQVYQQTHVLNPYSQLHHTPHTFPLQTSPNHCQQYFQFPPTHSTNNSQLTQHSRFQSLHISDKQPAWSNPALSPLMVKRINENAAAMIIDDDEDPSASIDAIVSEDDSNSSDLLHDQANKSLDPSNTSSTTPAGAISPSSHIYLRGTSHILTTPPNPLASDSHPDNQLSVGQHFGKTFSPIPSAGFELSSTSRGSVSAANAVGITSCFTFDGHLLEQIERKNRQHEDTTRDHLSKPLGINTDVRTILSTNNLIHDDNSNQSSSNSSSQKTSSRVVVSHTLQSSEHSHSSAPLATEIKRSSLDSGYSQQNRTHSISMQQQQLNKHSCTHPDCMKTFANKSALAKHKLTHSQDRKHKCSKCNKGFKRLDHLNGHMLTHDEEKPHRCRVPHCTRTYCDARSLKRHIENAHQNILAAIYDGGRDEFKAFLPETAFVKTKDPTINSDFSIDSTESNSPRSFNDQESTRTSTGTRTVPTYTFDEEKCVQCHICQKTFKNGAALNGHMRLHGGFNERPNSPSSTAPEKKPKRPATSSKRRRLKSPSASTSNDTTQQLLTIKNEKHDVLIIPSPQPSDHHSHPPAFSTFSPSSAHISRHIFSARLPSLTRARSASTSIVRAPTSSLPTYTIKDPLSVQLTGKCNPNHSPISAADCERSTMNLFNGMNGLEVTSTCRGFPNMSSPMQTYDGKMSGISSPSVYVRSHSNLSKSPLNAISSLRIDQVHPILQTTSERFPLDYQPLSSFIKPKQSSPSPHSPRLNSTLSMVNTPLTSPYSSATTNHYSPPSSSQQDNINGPIINHDTQPSPATNSRSSSSSPCSSLSSHVTPKKRFLDDMKQKSIVFEPPLPIIPEKHSPVTKPVSGFLIGTPSSTTTSSSSSSSSYQHFTYENIPPPKSREPTRSSFQWSSQFRRQLSLNITNQVYNPIPSTPYTPPPMLSPFRKGSGLYYRVFSHPASAVESDVTATAPLLPFTPVADDISGPKMNVGEEYQAVIPPLRTHSVYDDDTVMNDELLFSTSEFSDFDEQTLEKYEQLNRTNPFLFSPRHSPCTYPLDLVYMLLYEYKGDLQRTLAALLDGTANDIKQCRPLHRYRFSECDQWTSEEIDAFTKAMETSEKNFALISRIVGTKNVKQCIGFYYMPKIHVNSGRIPKKGTSAIMTRRKRSQMLKSKEQRTQLDDETSSSSFNECRFDEDGVIIHGDSFLATNFSCDTDECSQTFTSERAWRAHRKEHRRRNNSSTSILPMKRCRNLV